MAATSANFGDLLEAGLRKIFTDEYKAIPSMINVLYSIQTSKRADEKFSSVGGFSDFEDFTTSGTIAYDDVFQGYNKTFAHTEYAKGFKIQRALYDDDQYNIINRKPQALGLSAARTKEKHAMSPLNEAFVTAPSDGDGKTLCATDHPSNAPGVSVQSNKGTTALSATAVEATRLLMVDFRDDRGEKVLVQPDLLIIPRNLEETAWEIISSKGKVDTQLNNPNFHQGKYKLAVCDFLTDSNNWFSNIDPQYKSKKYKIRASKYQHIDSKIVELYKKGKSTRQIGLMLNIPKPSISDRLRANGIKMRSPLEGLLKLTGGKKVSTKCAYCNTLLTRWAFEIKRSPRHFCGNKCKGKWMSLHLIADKSSNWKGGSYSTIARTLCNSRYRRIRQSVLALDGYKCQLCPSTERLEVHHIIEKGKNPALIYDITNMITLCKKCHCGIWGKEESYIGFFDGIVANRANSGKPRTGNPELNSDRILSDKRVETINLTRKG